MISGVDSIVTHKRVSLIIFFIYILFNLALFGTSLSNYFLSDDFLLLFYASSGTLHDILISNIHYFRPLRMVIYTELYNIAGLNPAPYMLFNLLLHILNCFVVFLLIKEILIVTGEDVKKSTIKAFLCGALFCIHYIHAEAVLNISSTSELLFTLFYILSLYLFLIYKKTEKRKYYYYILILFSAALLTKETSIGLILSVFLIEKILFKNNLKYYFKSYYPLLLITIIFLSLRILIVPEVSSLYSDLTFTFYLFESIKNLIFAFTAMLFSLDFIAIKDIYKTYLPRIIKVFGALVKEQPLGIFAVITGFVFYAAALLRKDKVIILGFSLMLSAIIPFMWLAGYERYLYLPSFAFIMIFIQYFYNSKFLNIIKYAVISIFFIYNVFSLYQKKQTWDIAANESKHIITELQGINFPLNSHIYFRNLPDNYKGAWIFREGISYIPGLILKRDDIKFEKGNELIHSDPAKNILVLNYQNGKFITQ